MLESDDGLCGDAAVLAELGGGGGAEGVVGGGGGGGATFPGPSVNEDAVARAASAARASLALYASVDLLISSIVGAGVVGIGGEEATFPDPSVNEDAVSSIDLATCVVSCSVVSGGVVGIDGVGLEVVTPLYFDECENGSHGREGT